MISVNLHKVNVIKADDPSFTIILRATTENDTYSSVTVFTGDIDPEVLEDASAAFAQCSRGRETQGSREGGSGGGARLAVGPDNPNNHKEL